MVLRPMIVFTLNNLDKSCITKFSRALSTEYKTALRTYRTRPYIPLNDVGIPLDNRNIKEYGCCPTGSLNGTTPETYYNCIIHGFYFI